jgi:hypothetical protein
VNGNGQILTEEQLRQKGEELFAKLMMLARLKRDFQRKRKFLLLFFPPMLLVLGLWWYLSNIHYPALRFFWLFGFSLWYGVFLVGPDLILKLPYKRNLYLYLLFLVIITSVHFTILGLQ